MRPPKRTRVFTVGQEIFQRHSFGCSRWQVTEVRDNGIVLAKMVGRRPPNDCGMEVVYASEPGRVLFEAELTERDRKNVANADAQIALGNASDDFRSLGLKSYVGSEGIQVTLSLEQTLRILAALKGRGLVS